ncbi:N-acetylmuramoyl-L-alanine amidase [Faecalibacter sp. LW9]|uniref:N-acetylmuramoyl-L-alanine amidase n=1 Tax=Faecalibacter sp. LW9 TaxID=3103144 RepID=UPI002AFE5311|nr:N-acetylmuramoyl-L-alanine amidase [Faecalibacter sp. LW9]
MKKFALVIGHTKSKDKGAFSETLGLSEYDYNLMVAKELKALCPEMFDIYTHEVQDYYQRQKGLAYKVNQKNYDAVFELHFNAASPLANGTECCHYFNSKKGKAIAELISKEVSLYYKTTLRGVNGAKALVNKQDRGYWFTYLPKAPAVIIEPFFGSNPSEAKLFKDVNLYAHVLYSAIKKI